MIELHEACKNGDTEQFNYALRVDYIPENYEKAVIIACKHKHVEFAERLKPFMSSDTYIDFFLRGLCLSADISYFKENITILNRQYDLKSDRIQGILYLSSLASNSIDIIDYVIFQKTVDMNYMTHMLKNIRSLEVFEHVLKYFEKHNVRNFVKRALNEIFPDVCREGNFEIANLIYNRPDVIDRKSRNNSLYLISACKKGSVDVFNMCYNLNKQKYDLKTCFVLICEECNYDLCVFFFKRFSDFFNTLDMKKVLGLVLKDNVEFVKLLIDNGFTDYENGFKTACEHGLHNLVEFYTNNVIYIPTIPVPIHIHIDATYIACYNGHYEVIKCILPFMCAQSYHLRTACTSGNIALVKLLLHSGVRLDDISVSYIKLYEDDIKEQVYDIPLADDLLHVILSYVI